MTSMLPHRRRAEELADAIDGRRPARNAEVRELVAVAAAMQATPAVAPRADFTAELRAQLVAAAHRELSSPAGGEPSPRADRRRRSGYRRLGVAAATGAFVVVGGTTGIASASENALPGDLLYPVKRGVEQIDLAFTTNETERGRLELELAQTRLSEVEQLLASDDPVAQTLIAETLEDFNQSAREGSALLFESTDVSDRADAAALVNDFAVYSSLELDALAGALAGLPEGVAPVDEFTAAAQIMAAIDSDASDVCAACVEDESSVTFTEPAGGGLPDIIVTGPDGEVIASDTAPDNDAAGGSAGPPAAGSDHVDPNPPEVVGGSAGHPPADPGSPTTTPGSASGEGGGTGASPPATAAPPTYNPTAPPTSDPTAPPVDPTPLPEVGTSPAPDPEPSPGTEPSPSPTVPPTPTSESPEGDVEPGGASDPSDGETQSEPLPESEPTPEPTPEPESEPTLEPTPEPTLEPAPDTPTESIPSAGLQDG